MMVPVRSRILAYVLELIAQASVEALRTKRRAILNRVAAGYSCAIPFILAYSLTARTVATPNRLVSGTRRMAVASPRRAVTSYVNMGNGMASL